MTAEKPFDLYLLIPDLYAQRANLSAAHCLPTLEKLLSRAVVRNPWTVAGMNQSLLFLFNMDVTTPIAPITRLLDAGEDARQGIWMRADPVHLRADLDKVLLFDAAMGLNLTQDEAVVLTTELNVWYADSGWYFSAPVAERWYLSLEALPEFDTPPPSALRGSDIREALPMNASARQWRSLLNEVQMVLYQSTVNTERESRGLWPVNSTWFWGSGRLSAPAKDVCWTQVYSDDPLALGLANLCHVPATTLPTCLDDCSGNGNVLVTLSPPLDREGIDWLAWSSWLEKQWLQPSSDALKSRALRSVHICTGSPSVAVCYPRDSWCWWRRIRTLQDCL